MTDTQASTILSDQSTVLWLDPEAVKLHPNVRQEVGDVRALVKSVKELGVLEPVVVVPDGEDGYLLVYGQRRRAAATQAGCKLPAVVGADLGEARRIASQVAENEDSLRRPLTAGEKARAYEQLAALDVPVATIARMTGATKKEVETGRRVAGSELATTAADRYELTLDQAAVLTEFEDDREAVKALVVCARKNPGQFAHEASRIRQRREREQKHAAVVERFRAEGLVVAERVDHEKAKALPDLSYTAGGKPMTPKQHAACPGHAVVVPIHNPDRATFVCLDWRQYGHRDRTRSQAKAPMSPQDKAHRRIVIDNNNAWRAAEPVRHEYLRTLLARKVPPKGTLRFVAETLLRSPSRAADATDEMLTQLTGVQRPKGSYGRAVGARLVEGATDRRLELILLAQVAAAIEAKISGKYGVNTWRQNDRDVSRYFAFLASTGYGLAPVEQLVVDGGMSHDAREKAAQAATASTPTTTADEAATAAPVDEPAEAEDDQPTAHDDGAAEAEVDPADQGDQGAAVEADNDQPTAHDDGATAAEADHPEVDAAA